MYEVTAAGRPAARDWLHRPVTHGRDARSELLPKLALLDRAGADPTELLSAQLAEFHPIAAALEKRPGLPAVPGLSGQTSLSMLGSCWAATEVPRNMTLCCTGAACV